MNIHVTVSSGQLLHEDVAELDRLCSANNGLWCKAAEDYLLAHAPKVEIGEPKELVKERIIRLQQ